LEPELGCLAHRLRQVVASCLVDMLLGLTTNIFVHNRKGGVVAEISAFWRPKKNGRNVWFWLGIVFLALGVLKVNHVLNIRIDFVQLEGFGVLLLLVAFVEDLRYRFYRKFEQAEDEAVRETEESPTQR